MLYQVFTDSTYLKQMPVVVKWAMYCDKIRNETILQSILYWIKKFNHPENDYQKKNQSKCLFLKPLYYWFYMLHEIGLSSELDTN